MSIYTKKGDEGNTSLVNGAKVSKSEARINLYGEIDELNSCLGLAISYIETEKNLNDLAKELFRIQNELFLLGSYLACEGSEREKFKIKSLTDSNVTNLEKSIDNWDLELPKLKNFILPGGSLASSQLNICRCVCRRSERSLVKYKLIHSDEINSVTMKYINRLSDYFFSSARLVNLKLNMEEIVWKG
jgi:cob(I)alamin adenosyltransferase